MHVCSDCKFSLVLLLPSLAHHLSLLLSLAIPPFPLALLLLSLSLSIPSFSHSLISSLSLSSLFLPPFHPYSSLSPGLYLPRPLSLCLFSSCNHPAHYVLGCRPCCRKQSHQTHLLSTGAALCAATLKRHTRVCAHTDVCMHKKHKRAHV